MKLKTLDLFSGCGGITHALRNLAEPVAYCENEPTRVATLQSLFRKGLLPKATIHKDVQKLTSQDVHGIDMIAGGWPCIGFSSIGRRQGFKNEQSSLFSHLVRLVHELRPPLVFQENVPGVLTSGIDTIVDVFDKAGYDLWWCIIPAYAVGAPQQRRRWYCLAVRRDIKSMTLPMDATYERHEWRKYDNIPRMVLQKEPIPRFQMMGNGVCPDAVHLAFMLLFTGFQKSAAALWNATELVLERPPSSGIPLPSSNINKRCVGGFVHGRQQVIEKFELPDDVIPPMPDLKLRLLPTVYKSPLQISRAKQLPLTSPREVRMWTTPRAGSWGASHILTKRSSHDLCTAIRFEALTPDELRKGFTNPVWVECCLMGFPEGWTQFVSNDDES